MNDLIETNNFYNYCTICANELSLKGVEKVQHCININCTKSYYHIPTDSRVIELYMRDSHVFEFLLNIFIFGLSHPKHDITFKPLPFINGITNTNELNQYVSHEIRMNVNKIINEIKNILLNYDNSYSTVFELKLDMQIEMEIFNELGEKLYCIVKNAISNNYFSMSSRENDINDSVKFIHINYSTQVEERFRTGNFLFHGSKSYSWYPIIKNGLKVMSGTVLQANGAVHGKGIYFSDSYSMSYGYSSSTSYNIVGVFEIATNPDTFKKCTNIFVIPDDTIILLRTIIIAKSLPSAKSINEYFIKNMSEQKKINRVNSIKLQNKRLIGEHKKLSSCNFINSLEIISDEKWKIKVITNEQTNIIELEINFVNYPMLPPILILLNTTITNFPPQLLNQNNHIQLNILNPTEWKFTCSLLQVIENLKKCIEDTL